MKAWLVGVGPRAQALRPGGVCQVHSIVFFLLFKGHLHSFVCRNAAWARLCARGGDRSPIPRGSEVYLLGPWMVPAPCDRAVAKRVIALPRCHTGQAWSGPGNGYTYRARVADHLRGVLLFFRGGDVGYVLLAVVHFVADLRLLRSGSQVGVHVGKETKAIYENPPRRTPMLSCNL